MTAGSTVRTLLAAEAATWRSLGRWLRRRPDHGGPDATAFGYAQLAAPMIWLFVFGSAIEVVVIEVLLHHWGVPAAIRLPLLVLGVWGLLWMLGFMAGYRMHPHLLDADRLRARNGGLVDVAVPLPAVREVCAVEADLPTQVRSVQPEETEAGTHLRIGVSGRTNLRVDLAHPVTVRLPAGPTTVVALSLWADDPRALVAAIRRRTSVAS